MVKPDVDLERAKVIIRVNRQQPMTPDGLAFADLLDRLVRRVEEAERARDDWKVRHDTLDAAGYKVARERDTLKSKLSEAEKGLEELKRRFAKLECECDSYNGFTCGIHDWRHIVDGTLSRLRADGEGKIDRADEAVLYPGEQAFMDARAEDREGCDHPRRSCEDVDCQNAGSSDGEGKGAGK